MAGIIRFYYDENNEDVYEASILNSFKVIKNDNQHLTISIKTMDKTYDFNISSDDRWKNDLQLIVSFFNQNLEKVLNGSTGCKIGTFKDRCYVYFNFYEDFDGDAVEHGQFTGEYTESLELSMEKVFFVRNDELEIVNEELKAGGKIKFICPVNEPVSNAGGGRAYATYDIIGNVFAYVVIEYYDI